MHSDVSLIPFQVNSEWQDAGYFADEIVFLLERRISFRQIKNRIFKQFSLNPYIQGVRITCSGRVGGKSKKAQRARVDSIKYGQTSLHIFSSRIDFAARTADGGGEGRKGLLSSSCLCMYSPVTLVAGQHHFIHYGEGWTRWLIIF